MSAYLVVRILEITDPSWIEEYSAKAGPVVEKHNGQYIAKAPAALLEGDGPLPALTALLKFPSVADCENFYKDPEYQALLDLRNTGSKSEFSIVEGLD